MFCDATEYVLVRVYPGPLCVSLSGRIIEFGCVTVLVACPQAECSVDRGDSIEFTVWNENVAKDDVIGTCTFGPVGDALGTGKPHNQWIPMTDPSGTVQAGELHVKLQLLLPGGQPIPPRKDGESAFVCRRWRCGESWEASRDGEMRGCWASAIALRVCPSSQPSVAVVIAYLSAADIDLWKSTHLVHDVSKECASAVSRETAAMEAAKLHKNAKAAMMQYANASAELWITKKFMQSAKREDIM